jgi:hypothetical protein
VISATVQVSQLRSANAELQKHCLNDSAISTINTSCQTIPEHSIVRSEPACTSTTDDGIIQAGSAVAVAGNGHVNSDVMPEKGLEGSMEDQSPAAEVHLTKAQISSEEVLHGVKAVHAEMEKSVLQQMDALRDQYICLQVGQVSVPSVSCEP